MEDIFWFVVMITALGGIISWLGRTVTALLVAYFVVGCVGATVAYLGLETFFLASYGNTLASAKNIPILTFILSFIDLKPAAAFFSVFPEETRLWLIGGATAVSVIAVTLPFVTFANSIFSAMGADEGTKSVNSLGRFLRPKITAIEQREGELQTRITSMCEAIDSLKSETEKLRAEVESHNALQAGNKATADN
ncbi:hypothetical protein SG34_033035 [Thalassomonas viridans]|uniref:Uncharacterized protein n=1 Tax=Thalassomonas viridans TaxID=137584 RepID=A0AAF0CDN0_9GAMM|nr:hypothetical protein [Thalassomonas viridans]WDE08730.1 hypothetical protein SG34_033035 [Thalassomonas viridans]